MTMAALLSSSVVAAPRATTASRAGRPRHHRVRRVCAAANADGGAKTSRKPTKEILAGLWREVKYKPLREDESIEAVALLSTLELAKRKPGDGEVWTPEREEMRARAVKAVPGLVGEYWSARSKALVESQAVRDAAPLV